MKTIAILLAAFAGAYAASRPRTSRVVNISTVKGRALLTLSELEDYRRTRFR